MTNTAEQIKQRLDIVNFIREYIELKPAGANFKAKCPFHEEDTPSLMISPEKQIFKCFGCGKGGDIFTFLCDYENIDFELNSLVQYFNQEAYYTKAIHGDHEKFYNRDVIYPELMGFDEFYSIEDFIMDGYSVEEGYTFDTENNLVHHSPWISDYHLADQTTAVGRTLLEENTQFMLFPIMMMAHTPFDYDPYGYREDIYPQYVKLINIKSMR